ncbi:protein kinase [Pannus brasiliensis CCIBt3594]|uniref:Protein kinase n=1 Tax=Pannus brasiliensis CCIBt3594 TaxID=1427578 RepID=A0AAW9QVT2_9CHRO
MTLCINPDCPRSSDPLNANNSTCRNCGSALLLQNRYRILGKLGAGGFGDTYEIDDEGTRKVLKVLTEQNPKAIELFRQEASVLSRLNSNGIPKVELNGYFTLTTPKGDVLHCLVMEKIEGVDLARWMLNRSYRPIEQEQAIDWLRQLIKILDLVHSHQFFHRDIKPQNIMLRSTGELVLIDFGAVRQITSTILAGGSNTKIVSQGYSPPEQQNGYSIKQSDFFALGRTFVFLLTGKEPCDRAIYNPLSNKLEWRDKTSNISPGLLQLIDDLMEPIASNRPQNGKEILQRLLELEKNTVRVVPRCTRNQVARIPYRFSIGLAIGSVALFASIANFLPKSPIIQSSELSTLENPNRKSPSVASVEESSRKGLNDSRRFPSSLPTSKETRLKSDESKTTREIEKNVNNSQSSSRKSPSVASVEKSSRKSLNNSRRFPSSLPTSKETRLKSDESKTTREIEKNTNNSQSSLKANSNNHSVLTTRVRKTNSADSRKTALVPKRLKSELTEKTNENIWTNRPSQQNRSTANPGSKIVKTVPNQQAKKRGKKNTNQSVAIDSTGQQRVLSPQPPPKTVVRSSPTLIDPAQPWNVQDPIPSSSDSIEKIIREEK